MYVFSVLMGNFFCFNQFFSITVSNFVRKKTKDEEAVDNIDYDYFPDIHEGRGWERHLGCDVLESGKSLRLS